MSCKEYRIVYEYLSHLQRNAMYDLYMSGINRDGHTWVTYGDVEKCVAKMFEPYVFPLLKINDIPKLDEEFLKKILKTPVMVFEEKDFEIYPVQECDDEKEDKED